MKFSLVAIMICISCGYLFCSVAKHSWQTSAIKTLEELRKLLNVNKRQRFYLKIEATLFVWWKVLLL